MVTPFKSYGAVQKGFAQRLGIDGWRKVRGEREQQLPAFGAGQILEDTPSVMEIRLYSRNKIYGPSSHFGTHGMPYV